MTARILGAVIAGGKATRFGSDKALALVDGSPMIDHVLASLRPWVDAIAICGRSYGDLLSLPDLPKKGLGPLGGIAAALRYARDTGFDAVLTVPCDTPRICPGIFTALRAESGAAFLPACPIIGIWPATLSEALTQFIAADARRSVAGWARTVDAVPMPFAGPANINRPDDRLLLDR